MDHESAHKYFDRDDANIGHIAEHGVTPQEAEEVITNDPLDIDYSERNGEAPHSSGGRNYQRTYSRRHQLFAKR